MNKKAHGMKMHILIGVAVLAILYYLNLTYMWVDVTDNMVLLQLVGVAVIYSLMPDIDQPGSKINKWVTVALGGVIVYAFYNPLYQSYGIIAAAILVLLRVIEHRTLIHSVIGAAIISAPLLYLGVIHAVVGFAIFLSHIIADGDFSFGWEKDWKVFKR